MDVEHRLCSGHHRAADAFASRRLPCRSWSPGRVRPGAILVSGRFAMSSTEFYDVEHTNCTFSEPREPTILVIERGAP